MRDIVGKRWWFILFSLVVILPGAISLAIPPGLRLGIEFTSGSTMTLRFEQPVTQADLRDALTDLGQGDAIVQHTGEGNYQVRTRALTPVGPAEGTEPAPTTGERQRIENALRDRFGPFDVLDFYSVSPIIAEEVVRNAALAVAAAALGILFYITWAFRRVPRPFRYGACAVIALIHDTLVVLGIFSILGKAVGIEIDSMFITALLTVIGFSVHDTIVVFDRIRENLRLGAARDFDTVVNYSLLQTLGRSLSTSLTVVFTLLALYLFGGITIRNFALALLIGIVSGTYSSIFNASQLLVIWEKGEMGRFWRRAQTPATARRGG